MRFFYTSFVTILYVMVLITHLVVHATTPCLIGLKVVLVSNRSQGEFGVITPQSEATQLHCNPDAKLTINPSGTLQHPTHPPPALQRHTLKVTVAVC